MDGEGNLDAEKWEKTKQIAQGSFSTPGSSIVTDLMRTQRQLNAQAWAHELYQEYMGSPTLNNVGQGIEPGR